MLQHMARASTNSKGQQQHLIQTRSAWLKLQEQRSMWKHMTLASTQGWQEQLVQTQSDFGLHGSSCMCSTACGSTWHEPAQGAATGTAVLCMSSAAYAGACTPGT